MAKRYRYSFAKKKESGKGILSVGLGITSVVLLVLAIILSMNLSREWRIITGGIGLFAMLLSVYGFFVGLAGFSEEGSMRRMSMIGSIGNGIIMIGWISLFLTGV